LRFMSNQIEFSLHPSRSSLLPTIFNKAEMFCIRVSGFASEPHIYCFVQGILLDIDCAPVRSKFLPPVSASGRLDRHGGSYPARLC
jgi:hypothetical protein